MREIVFDTETTGVKAEGGDRICEIGAVEVFRQIPTGNTFHVYINPQIPMPEGAFAVHGLSDEFLADKPLFAHVVDDFLAFVGEDKLVAHNASFDMAFINAELKRINKPVIPKHRSVDTLALARKKHPGSANSLDALCARYGIDNSRRTKHGALLDSELLAEVYLELMGGRQSDFLAVNDDEAARLAAAEAMPKRTREKPLETWLSTKEIAAHEDFIETFKEAAIWKRYNIGKTSD